MPEITAVLDSNSVGASTASLSIDKELRLSMYVYDDTGTHDSHAIELEVSPNNIDWFATDVVVYGIGFSSSDDFSANHCRATVVQAEGATSTVNVTIIAK